MSSTLIDNFYEFFGGELLILGGIKVSKTVKETILGKLQTEEDDNEGETDE